MLSKMFLVVCLMTSATLVLGQRPSFAGIRPIGYPETTKGTTTEGLGNRFGEGDGTTPKGPIEANGDLELIDRLSKLPIDQQPFWFINWQALEAHRNKTQTYPQRPSVFANNQNVVLTSTAQTNTKPDSTLGNSFGSADSNSGVINPNSNNFLTSTSESANSYSDSIGDKFEDTTEDIQDRYEVTRADKVSSSKNSPDIKEPFYF